MSAKSAAIKKKKPLALSLGKAALDWMIRVEHPDGRFSDQEFAQFCLENPELRIEMTKEGEMSIMLPVVTRGGQRNFFLTGPFTRGRRRTKQAWASIHQPVSLCPMARSVHPMSPGCDGSAGRH